MQVREKVLQEIFEENNKVFGMKSQIKGKDNDMFSLLTWENKDGPSQWDFKKNNINPNRDKESKKYQASIAHTENRFMSESKDNYRPIKRLANGIIVQEVDENVIETMKQIKPEQRQVQFEDEKQQINEKADIQLNKTSNQSQYRDEYMVKDIRTYQQFQHQIEENMKKGHKIAVLSNQDNAIIDQVEVVKSEEEETDEEFDDRDKLNLNDKNKVNQKQKYNPKDQLDALKIKRRRNRLKQMKNTSKQLPNTSFTTYYGKPSWGPYGYGNTKPAVGGFLYGHHMLSHNIQPHRQQNPFYTQTYTNALRQMKNHPDLSPKLPRNFDYDQDPDQNQIEENLNRNPLTAIPFDETKKKIAGSQNIQLHLSIEKPDLLNKSSKPKNNKLKKETVQEQEKERITLSETKPKNKKKPKTKEESKRQQKKEVQIQPEDKLALQDRTQIKFMDELLKKKEHSNRLTGKVGEAQPKQQRPASAQQKQSPIKLLKDEISQIPITQLQEYELDPKFYKNIPQEWLQRIPAAGKQYVPGEKAVNCFDFGF